jgi:prepilin-type N-terminal cleavage/methylation domain-containing protein
MLRHAHARAGFTLLEMVLALSIGLVLMISLYSVLNLQVQQTQNGRLILNEGKLARGILARMTRDILSSLGPVTTQPAPASGPPPVGSSAATTITNDSTIVFNTGIYGTSNMVMLTVSKVPRWWVDQAQPPALADPTQQATACDLRRISYWIVTDGGKPALAVQELMQATSSDLTTVPPDVTPGSYQILASEVKDVTFQYFDGVSWNDTWDGTTLGGPTGEIPIGPPSAISITLTFSRPSVDGVDPPDAPKYTHVVAIPAGNNFPQTNQ